MTIDYEILVKGNNLRFACGYCGLANLTLIKTPEGPIMFDVGHTVNRQGLVAGLKARGLTPADVPRVFLSHLHVDHVMNIGIFPYSTKVYVSRIEWEYAADPHPEDPWVPWLIREQLQKYDLQLIEGEGELVPGVRYFPVPGHTPGSMALDFDVKDKGRVVLAGDALKFPREMLQQGADHAFDSHENASASIRLMLSMADRIVPGHFPEMIRRGDTFLWDEPAELTLLIR